jgi:hypothetical protein
MQSNKPNDVEPFALSVAKTAQATSESRSRVYQLLADGTYEAVKSGKKTLILVESVRRRFASLPRAAFKAPPRPPRVLPEKPHRGRKPKPAASASSPES